MPVHGVAAIVSPFRTRSFRFQFCADLLVAWAIEMEVLILAWYVLTATDSAIALAVVGALRFGGTLISPLVGTFADGGSRKRLLVAIRLVFAFTSLAVMALALAGALAPWHAFVAAAVTGLLRPADMMLRQSLIADAVPREALTGAMAVVRMTLDSARVVGALAGAGLMAAFGVGGAYALVAGFYLAAVLLTLPLLDVSRGVASASVSLRADLRAALAVLRDSTDIRHLLALAFLVNLTVLSITGGLLPLVAREVYGIGSTGLGSMVATFAGCALAGSLLTTAATRVVRPERLMLAAAVLWHVLMVGFAHITAAQPGIVMLGVIGFVSSFTMIPMASCLLLAIPPAFRARIMGLRQLAVFGLPLGLLMSGPLVEMSGIAFTMTLYGLGGLACTLAIAWSWRRGARGVPAAAGMPD